MSLKYETRSLTVESLLGWIKSGDIAIPEIQRPFVWTNTQVRDFLDSLYRGYPVGYIITWKNPDIITKDGRRSDGKRILIDGQQRMTALMAALLGHEVFNKHYKRVRIRIAFNLKEQQFDVWNQAIHRDPRWIEDISILFAADAKMHRIAKEYAHSNPDIDLDEIHEQLSQLHRIITNPIGIIELDAGLDINTVAEIFIRINSKGTPLNQADFVMSKISVNTRYDGDKMRRAIDYFCQLAVSPEFYDNIRVNDPEFMKTDYCHQMAWLHRDRDDIYDPKYSDVIRVAFTSEFERGKLSELVALLSGRNFETRQYEEAVIEDTFARFKVGVMNFMNETHFKRLINIIRSAGFIRPDLITSKMNVNYTYVIYLWMRKQGLPNNLIEQLVRRWFVFSVLTSRYTSSIETQIAQDLSRMRDLGAQQFIDMTIERELSDAFWESILPDKLNASIITNVGFSVFIASQVKLGDCAFLSRDIRVHDLLSTGSSEIHHIFPKAALKRAGVPERSYNQVANYAIIQSDINVAIGDQLPHRYFEKLMHQCETGRLSLGNIADADLLRENMDQNCIPEGVFNMTIHDYDNFLQQRRRLMSQRIRQYFNSL